jgi:hypothetical protein
VGKGALLRHLCAFKLSRAVPTRSILMADRVGKTARAALNVAPPWKRFCPPSTVRTPDALTRIERKRLAVDRAGIIVARSQSV